MQALQGQRNGAAAMGVKVDIETFPPTIDSEWEVRGEYMKVYRIDGTGVDAIVFVRATEAQNRVYALDLRQWLSNVKPVSP